MENYKTVATEFNAIYMGFNFIVVKITEDAYGYVAKTTHFFDDEEKAYDKFMTKVFRESDIIYNKPSRAGYSTKNIVEIDAMTNEKVLEAYGTYDTASGSIITQVLLMKNPNKKSN